MAEARLNTTDGNVGRFKCFSCTRIYDKQSDNFFISGSDIYIENDYYIPWCKKCINDMYKRFIDEYHSDDMAMRRICMMTDSYWSPEIFGMTDKPTSAKTRVELYFSKLNTFKYRGLDYSDTIRDEGGTIGTVVKLPDDSNADDNRKLISVPQETIDFFGPGLSSSMYKELARRYDAWKKKLGGDISDPGAQAIVKQICNLEMTINRDMTLGRAIDKNTNALNNLLSSANLKPSQRKDELDAEMEATPFGVWINKIENTEPIPEPAPEFRDVDGIGRYITVWFFGHLCHMLHIDNEASRAFEEYQKEKDKYTVEKPHYEGDDEEEDPVDEDIFDKARAKHQGGS